MNNTVIQTLAFRQQARIMFVENTELIGALCRRHPPHPLLRLTLGQTVSAASLIAGMLKGDERLSVVITATNSQYRIYTDVEAAGHVRGYLSEALLAAPWDACNREGNGFRTLIGDRGSIRVAKHIGLDRAFTGITDMPYGSVEANLSHYYRQSEQTATWFHLDIQFDEDGEVSSSRGILAQLLPGAPGGLLDQIRQAIAHRGLESHLSSSRRTPILEWPFSVFEDIRIVGTLPVQLFCVCSKEALMPLLHGLGGETLRSACDRGEDMEIACSICGSRYRYSPQEIGRLL